MRRTKEDAEQTRQKVIEAALELFSRNGYSNTTLAMIADMAGFSRGPIYWHFRNKDELYQAVLAVSQEPLRQLIAESQAVAETPLAALEHFVSQWFRLLVTNPAHRRSFEILLNKTEFTAEMAVALKRERELTRQMVGLLADLVSRAQAQGVATTSQSPQSLGLLVYSSLMGITHTWLFSPKLFKLKDEAPAFTARLLVLLRPA